MLMRVVIVGVMVLSLFGFGSMALLAMRQPAAAPLPQPRAEPTVAVLVAAHPVHAGQLLHQQDLSTHPEPSGDIPPGALRDTPQQRNELAGALMRVTIPSGGLLLLPDMVQPGDHGYLAAVLPPGMRAVSIGVDAVSGVAGLVWPGDDVDLILTQSFDDPGTPLSRRLAARTVLSGLRVIATDQDLVRGERPDSAGQPGRTITLSATPDQAQIISVASRVGRLSLSVRSIDGTGQVNPVATVPIQAATWNGALGLSDGDEAAASTLHVFNGASDTKDYKLP